MSLPFVDTNVFLRHIVGDHPDQSPRATALFERIERGEVRVRVADTVIFETVFSLQRFYRIPRSDIRGALLALMDLPGVVLSGKQRLRRVFDYYVTYNLSFADAYHAVLVEALKLPEIVSFDRDYDRIPGLRRVEP
jgi:predicted nucleic acid-binding protein